MKTLAIIPVYRNIGAAIAVLSRFKADYVDRIFLAVDDIEGTDEEKIRRKIKGMSTPVFVFVNKERKGIGYAIREGIEYGILNKFDVAVVLAGNNKDNPDEIPRLLEPLIVGQFDYVQGSRFLPGGKRVNNPYFRGVFSRLYPFLWTLITKRRCTDVTNGFRAYRLDLFLEKKFNIHQDWLNGYQLEYYIHFKVLTLGYKVKEVPVSKTYEFKHKGGYSQISPLRDWWKIVGPLIYLRLGIKE